MTDSDSPSIPTPRICPTCGETIGAHDKFCPMCGANLAQASRWVAPVSGGSGAETGGTTHDDEHDIAPLPGSNTSDSSRRKRRKTRKRPWYKRPLILIPLILLLLLGGVAGVLAWQTRSALDNVHSVSTPPPEVAASSLGGDEDITIDTGPAQAALEERANRNQPTTVPTDPPVEQQPTDPPATSAASTSTTNTNVVTTGSSATPAATEDGEAAFIGASPAPVGGTPISQVLTETPSPPPTIEPTKPPVVATDGLTVLLMGVDSREGEAIDIGVRPDSLAVLHIDEQTGSCRMLAVPRDSRAELPGYGYSKINHALAVAGIPYEMLVIEEYLGLEIDNYALIDFGGLEAVVDALGGISVDNPEEFVMGDQTFPAGTLHLDGEQALLYSRFRGDSQGDFGRISRQQQVLRAMMNEATDVNVVTTLPSMFTMLSDHFRTDFGVGDLVDLANDYRNDCTADSIETQTIPGDVSMEYDELMQQELSFVVSDPAIVQQNVAWLLGKTDEEPIDTTPATPVAVLPGFQRGSWVTRGRPLRVKPMR